MGEIETIEDIIDDSIDSIGKPGSRKGKFLRAIAFVVKRRTDPGFTLDQAANLRIQLKDTPAHPPAGDAEHVVPNRAARRQRSRKRG